MAKIFLRGKLQGVEVNDETAKQMKTDWLLGSLPDVVEVGETVFKRTELKSIEDIYKEKQEKKYDLNNFDDKEIIKSFEKEFISWLKNHQQYKDNPFSVHKWYESLGLIKIHSEDFTQFGVYKGKVKEFVEIQKKWSALQSLRIRRVKAKEYNEPPTEEINVAELNF